MSTDSSSAAGSRARAHALHEQEVRRGQVCHPAYRSCSQSHRLYAARSPRASGARTWSCRSATAWLRPSQPGVQVVHVQDCARSADAGQGAGEVVLPCAAGPVDRDDLRCAATRSGLADGQERRGDRLVRRCEVHVWTVDGHGPRSRALGRLAG
jgi:hypothetical protein